MAHNFIAEELRILLLKTEAVILIILLPVFQLDDEVDLLLFLDALHAEERLDIDDSDTAKFNEISRDVWRRADQRVLVDLADLDHIALPAPGPPRSCRFRSRP